ncbi:hypothetical protein LZ32DRAFT_311195 [Colletotrichum eremochloae]|nr:hypothetical protein LZ32DRAFT_311195 [Colletotrichum eremochloae]
MTGLAFFYLAMVSRSSLALRMRSKPYKCLVIACSCLRCRPPSPFLPTRGSTSDREGSIKGRSWPPHICTYRIAVSHCRVDTQEVGGEGAEVSRPSSSDMPSTDAVSSSPPSNSKGIIATYIVLGQHVLVANIPFALPKKPPRTAIFFFKAIRLYLIL